MVSSDGWRGSARARLYRVDPCSQSSPCPRPGRARSGSQCWERAQRPCQASSQPGFGGRSVDRRMGRGSCSWSRPRLGLLCACRARPPRGRGRRCDRLAARLRGRPRGTMCERAGRAQRGLRRCGRFAGRRARAADPLRSRDERVAGRLPPPVARTGCASGPGRPPGRALAQRRARRGLHPRRRLPPRVADPGRELLGWPPETAISSTGHKAAEGVGSVGTGMAQKLAASCPLQHKGAAMPETAKKRSTRRRADPCGRRQRRGALRDQSQEAEVPLIRKPTCRRCKRHTKRHT